MHWTKYTFDSRFASRAIIVIQVYYGNRIFAFAALLLLAATGLYSAWLAVADAAFRRQTPESVAHASAMMPDHAGYLLFRALQVDYDGGDATALLERAARVAPLSSAPRIRLGLAAETRGDFSAAEKWLLEAARVDRQFEPRWTLANFYFRRQNAGEFWRWMRAALEVSYGDRRLAFELCRRMTQDDAEVLARAIPERHDVLAAYLVYVVNQWKEAVGPVALKLAGLHNREDLADLETACDVLLDNGKIFEARAVWKQIGHAQSGLLTNGDFAKEPTGHGFDWRPRRVEGVTEISLPGEYRIQLSGTQPESCELLVQLVALEAGKQYSLRWEARTQGLGSTTGISNTGIEWTAGEGWAAVYSAEDWRGGTLDFKAGSTLVPITLAYRRSLGQARTEGSMELRAVSLVERPLNR